MFDKAEYHRRWVLKNPARMLELRKRWYWKNKEKILAYRVAYRKGNVSKFKDRNRAYRNEKPNITRWNSIKSSSIRRGMPLIITRSEFLNWFAKQEQKCSYCDLVDINFDQPLSMGKPITFTIDRKDSGLPYSIKNICLSCWRCNNGKGNRFTSDEWREIAQRYIKPKWQRMVEDASGS